MVKKLYALMMAVFMAGNVYAQATSHKVPARIVNVNGAVNNQYSIIQTTIYRSSGQGAPAATTTTTPTSTPTSQMTPSPFGQWGDWSGGFDLANELVTTLQEQIPTTPQTATQTSSNAGKPIITRAQLDLIGPTNQSSTLLDVKLELPMPPVSIEQHGAWQVVGKVGQMVGAVGVEAGQAMMQGATSEKERAAAATMQAGSMVSGAGISSIAMLADYANYVAERQLDKLYENQQFRISLLEIIPTRYYTIDMRSNKITPTKTFEVEVTAYQAKIKEYLAALKSYQDISSIYAQWYKKLVDFDPSGRSQPQQWQQLRDYDAKTVRPAMLKKNTLETDLTKMTPPYRMAIMASPSAGGNTCGKFGNGPWEVYIIYYLGAMQTNQIAIRYCVPNPRAGQTFIVELMQNAIQQIDPRQQQQKFMPGGLQLVADQNASFSRSVGFQSGDYGGTKTGVLNWFTKMVTNEEGDSIDHLLVPFNIHELRTDATARVNAANKARMDEVTGIMDSMIKRSQQMRQQMGQYGMMGGGMGMYGGLNSFARDQFSMPTDTSTGLLNSLTQQAGQMPVGQDMPIIPMDVSGAAEVPGAVPVQPSAPAQGAAVATPPPLPQSLPPGAVRPPLPQSSPPALPSAQQVSVQGRPSLPQTLPPGAVRPPLPQSSPPALPSAQQQVPVQGRPSLPQTLPPGAVRPPLPPKKPKKQ